MTEPRQIGVSASEGRKASHARYRARNRDKIRSYNRKYAKRDAVRKRRNATQKRRYYANHDKCKSYKRIYEFNRKLRLKPHLAKVRLNKNLRKTAIVAGNVRYMSVLQCNKCRSFERYTRNSSCVVCKKEEARKNIKQYRLNGPQNPKGEMQWLRKNKAQLKNLRRAIRNLGREQSPIVESAQARNSQN